MSSEHRKALSLAQAGDWEGAHEIVQQHSDAFSCLIHAYLHRVEGDSGNAAYWYRRAGEAMPEVDTEQELQQLFQREQARASD